MERFPTNEESQEISAEDSAIPPAEPKDETSPGTGSRSGSRASLILAGAVAAAGFSEGNALAADSISKTNQSSVTRTEKKGSLSAQYHESQKFMTESVKKIMAHDADVRSGKLTVETILDDAFLKSYHEYVAKSGNVPDGGNALIRETNERIVEEGAKMRALHHAWLNDVNIDLSKGFTSFEGAFVGHVLTGAKLNGVDIPVRESDFTVEERKAVENAQSIKKDAPSKPAAETNAPSKARVSPDFDSGGDF